MTYFSDIFHKFPRLYRISTLFLVLLIVFPAVFLNGCTFSKHASDQTAPISSGHEPNSTDPVSSESIYDHNQHAANSSCTAFDEFLLQLFRSEVAQNTINLHFSLSSPASYGITDIPISLGSISSQTSKENRADLENTPDSVFCAHGAGFEVKWDEVDRMAHLPLLDFREKEEEAEKDSPSLAFGAPNEKESYEVVK